MKILVVVALAILALLAGCAAHQQAARIEIPIAAPCPVPPVIARPALPIAQLNEQSTPDQVARAYAATVEILMGYARQLETLLNGYREETAP